MKQFFETLKFLVFMLLFVKTNLALKGQDCGGIPYSQEAYVNYSNTQFSPLLNESIIYVYFVVYRNDDGTNGVGIERLYSIMERLNTSFESANFKFIWNECETSFVNNTTLNNEQGRCLFVKSHLNGLEIHVRGDTNGRAAAYSNEIPGDMVIIGGTFEINNGHSLSGVTYSNSHSIVHEVGHAFGLFHTHHGVCTGEESIGLCPTGNITVPFPDNDFVDDTPLDPNLQRKIGSGCQWNGDKCQNPDINISNPLTNNYMSYTKPSCMNSFTPGQITRMQMLCLPNVKFSSFKPLLDEGKIANFCSLNSKNLNQLLAEPLPCIEVKWSTDSDPSDGIITVDGNIANSNGTYYAYFYNSGEYSGASIPVVVECCNESPDVTISENTEITGVLSAGSYLVKSGITLTVKGRMEFNFGKGIIIEQGGKLIVDGGVLTNCAGYSSNWKGIKVSSDLGFWWFAPPTTIVEVKNGGIIENADVAIDAVGQITFLSTSNVGGAKILINTNSIIRNCEYGVKLGPLYGVQEQSTFSNAQFTNLGFAVDLDNNHGLNIKSCQFSGNSYDIQAHTSSLLADNNDFNGGVVFENLFPNFTGSTFINNRFYDGGPGGSGILLDAFTNVTDFNIHNNQFFETGVLTLGELDFDIRSNDFHDAPQGTWISDSGGDINNFVTANNFYGNGYANSASGINDTEYEKNCFEATADWDIEVTDGASIHLLQGEEQDAAGNCFSKKIVTGTDSEHFDYYVLQSTSLQSCKKPGYAGNFTILEAFFDQNIVCGTGTNIYGNLPPRYRDCTYTNATDLKNMIAELRKEIKRLEADKEMNPWTRRWLIAKFKRCLDRAIKLKAKDDLELKGKDSAVTFLVTQPEFRYQAMAYGLIMESTDQQAARSILSGLSASDAGEQEFVSVQNIYLDHLTDRANFVLSPANQSLIYQAGIRKHPLAGFSRSVYYTLTGQKIPVNLEHLDNKTVIRTNYSESEDKTVIIFPNPTDHKNITVVLSDFDTHARYTCSITDMFGREIGHYILSSASQNLDLMVANSGIFIIKIAKDDRLEHIEKLIVN